MVVDTPGDVSKVVLELEADCRTVGQLLKCEVVKCKLQKIT